MSAFGTRHASPTDPRPLSGGKADIGQPKADIDRPFKDLILADTMNSFERESGNEAARNHRPSR
jgi:hypothetical protein